MSRTFKSKDAQRAHNRKIFSRKFGYDYTWGDFQTESEDYGVCYLPIRATLNKRETFEEVKYIKFKDPSFPRSGIANDEKRIENKKHRSRVRRGIHAFMSGRSEDVIANAVGPRKPKHWW